MSNTKGTSAIVPPQGGGAQSGLGEKFSPDLFTGTGNFSVPIAVPPGRNGFQPELTLGYSSGNGNGTFGIGWALGVPGITRKTAKGVPVYDDGKDVFILSGAEDLVPVATTTSTYSTHSTGSGTSGSGGESITHQKTTYRPRTEGLFARIVHHKKSNGENYWEVRSKDGLVSFYGTPDSEGNDTCVIANPENRNSIFAWCLSKTVDPYGNEIIYEYDRELDTETTKANPHKYDQLYLSSIKYAQYIENGEKKYLCEVKFNYEEREDAFSSYRQGFEMRTTKRCLTIETFTHSDITRKTKTYHFNYLSGDKLPLNGVSMLESVSVEGHKEEESEWMPPLEFGYSKFKPSRRGLKSIDGPIPVMSLSQPGFELADLNGNGLPDLLQLDGTARYWTNKGNGEFSNPRMLKLAPSIQLGQEGVQLIDANGNGRNDLMVSNGMMNGYFPGEFGGVWSQRQFRPYSNAPSVNFADPEVQLMDLDGDGMTDVLKNGAKFECFYNDPQKGFDKVRTAVRQQTDADFSFADPRIRFTDMTGDGLQDIVLISSGRVQYWPNLGYGRFGEKVNMKNAPHFPEQYNPAQVLIGDLDGDGLADIAFVENNSVTLYVNQSANGFSEGTKIVNTPQVFNPNDLRITDVLGTGQPGILWSMAGTDGRNGKMYFLDFTKGNKPYILEEMNNNMGSITRVEYGSSVYHYLRDQKNPKTRWQTELPFPVQVVNRVEVIDLLSGGKLATEYRYHHGYWDGAEREFRGFARVDTVDTESFERLSEKIKVKSEKFKDSPLVDNLLNMTEYYSPPVETRSWFYPGPVGEDFTRWHEVDFSDEYWSGDENVLKRTQEMKELLASLPRRARRDALRTMRGTLLRSETYGLDGSTLQDRPYTVTESLMSVRLEDKSEKLKVKSDISTSSMTNSIFTSDYVFFPFNVAQRTTQYERGNDPMHSMSFVKGYDTYGHPTGELSVGLPRGSSPESGGSGNYLATYGESEFIYKDIPDGQYMVDRVKRSISYDATKPSGGTSVFAFKDSIFESQATLDVIGCSLNFYDGDAFVGMPYGEIGDFGAVMRSETLVITDDIITEAYGSNTPECFKATPDWSDSNGYPAIFAGELQNGDVRLGYKDRRTGFPNHIEGWYAEDGRTKYDWQQFDPLIDPPPVGLVLESKDVFDNKSTIEYDDYQMLPLNAKQWLNGTDYLETTAEYNYRVMQAFKITDPNDNITEFDFSPLGLLTATAVIGKGTEGDYKAATGTFHERFAPSVRMEYDFFAFVNEGDPVWVKTMQREQHWQDDPDPDSPTIVSKEYSDGFGRLLQTRAQSEDVLYGNQIFGSSGLPADQNAQNSPAVGVERDEHDPLNVVVSGWKIYNNKGEVVEQYEPYFDKGFDYTLPQLSDTGGTIPPQLGVKIKMYYDTLGRVVRTVNPDNSEQRVIFGIPNALNTPEDFTPTPWESYAYDANDLAPLTNPTGSNVPASHYYTPKSSLIDTLGRTIQTTEHKASYNADSSQYEDVVMKYFYDIRGNLLEVRDPYNRKVFEHLYDLRPPQKDESGEQQPLPPLWTKHIDQEEGKVLFDAMGKPIESSDAKGAVNLSTFGIASRPTYSWAKDNNTGDYTVRHAIIYGDSQNHSLVNPKITNHLGQPYKNYDESGLDTISEYDFKGNVTSANKQVIKDDLLLEAINNGASNNWEVSPYLVDWTITPWDEEVELLEGHYQTDVVFDALNRPVETTYPSDINNSRKIATTIYNRAGNLEKITFDGTDYINHIAYNAKGDVILTAYGNGIMNRQLYDNKTFFLKRTRTSAYIKTGWTFEDNSGVKEDKVFNFDLVGNIIETHDQCSGCGLPATPNELTRNFSNDPLYRLLNATGRESNTQSSSVIWGDPPTAQTPNAQNSRNYTQAFEYDKLGNILKKIHTATGNNYTRKYNYQNGKNTLTDIDNNQSSPTIIADFSYDATGNQTICQTERHYEWDYGNRMKAFYNQSSAGSEPSVYAVYLYDGGGNRTKKLVRKQGGTWESVTYIGGTFEYHKKGTEEKNYTQVANVEIRTGSYSVDVSDSVLYQMKDHLGSVGLRINHSGSTIDREEYYPFGDSSLRTFTKKRYRYCGKEKDEESGLYYYGARYYMAWVCRFTSIDPLAADYMHLTPYNYAGNKPITYYDIDGMQGNGEQQSNTNFKHSVVVSDNTKVENLYTIDVDLVDIGLRDEYEKSIMGGDIFFTENYGWVDNSHAFKDSSRDEPYIGVEELWRQLKNEPSPDQIHMGYYSVNYKQDIVKGNISIGIERQYLIKPGLSLNERKSVALAIFQDVSMAFEKLQGVHPTSGSSYEPADLPSNMLRFYHIIGGFEKTEIKSMIKPLSPEKSIEVYRSYPGTFTDNQYKNKSFAPRYFKTPYTSINFGIPDKLNTIEPASISSIRDFGKANLILFDQDIFKIRNSK